MPVLPWPDQLQVVSSVETNGSRVARQSLLQGGAAIQMPRPETSCGLSCELSNHEAQRNRARRQTFQSPPSARRPGGGRIHRIENQKIQKPEKIEFSQITKTQKQEL